jgi:hypothetical protein
MHTANTHLIYDILSIYSSIKNIVVREPKLYVRLYTGLGFLSRNYLCWLVFEINK